MSIFSGDKSGVEKMLEMLLTKIGFTPQMIMGHVQEFFALHAGTNARLDRIEAMCELLLEKEGISPDDFNRHFGEWRRSRERNGQLPVSLPGSHERDARPYVIPGS